MYKVWIDVTTTMAWNRAAVGIVRVEQELIKYSILKPTDFSYFTFHNGKFEEISQERVVKKLQSFQVKKVETISQIANKKSNLPLIKSKLKNSIYMIIFGIFELLTLFLSDKTYTKLRDLTRELFRLVKKGIKLIIGRHDTPINVKQDVSVPINYETLSRIFNYGDVILSVGLSWDHGEKFESFYHMKKFKNLKIVSMCYDLIPIKYPNLTVSWDNSAKFEHNYVNMTWASDLVLSISNHSKLDYQGWIHDHFMPEPKIEVIELGSTITKYDIAQVSKDVKLLAQSKYILFVSTIERRKNHETIVKAIQYLIDQKSEYIPKVVFVGMKGWGVDDFFNDFELNTRVHPYISLHHGVNDDDLSYLYEKCEFFIYPSFYEGWGLPIAEGLQYGKFGLSSNTSSMPEVGKDLLDYLYPFDVVGWAKGIEYYIKNKDELIKRENNVKENFVEYTWESFSNKVFQHITEDLNH